MLKGVFRCRDERGLSPIAWALLELDEIGHSVAGASIVDNPCWRIDSGPGMTSREVISFTIEATARASSRLKLPKSRT